MEKTYKLFKCAEKFAAKYDRMTSILNPKQTDEANYLAKTFKRFEGRTRLEALKDMKSLFLDYYQNEYGYQGTKDFLAAINKLIDEEIKKNESTES